MVAAWCMLGLARADVRIDGTFASHMVLQREKPIAVQGSAARNEEVTVEFAGQKKTAKADAKGKWQVALDPLEASKEPRIMVVQGATGAPIQFEDVLVGEVWLGAGQSNWFFTYEQQAKDSAGRGEKDEVLAAIVNAQHPLVRLNYGRNIWVAATDPDTNKKYSALMLAFGVALQKQGNRIKRSGGIMVIIKCTFRKKAGRSLGCPKPTASANTSSNSKIRASHAASAIAFTTS